MTFIDIKIIMLGDASVGKTSIVYRYVDSTWNRQYHQNTIGFVLKTSIVMSNGRTWNVGIWDTAGSERYQSLTKSHYRNANCAILCFDPSVPKSWERVVFWHNELLDNTDNCKIFVCATKKDLIDNGTLTFDVNMDSIDAFVTQIGAKYFFVSSRTGENIKEMFQTMVDDCTECEIFMADLDHRQHREVHNEMNAVIRNNITRNYEKSESCCSLL